MNEQQSERYGERERVRTLLIVREKIEEKIHESTYSFSSRVGENWPFGFFFFVLEMTLTNLFADFACIPLWRHNTESIWIGCVSVFFPFFFCRSVVCLGCGKIS